MVMAWLTRVNEASELGKELSIKGSDIRPIFRGLGRLSLKKTIIRGGLETLYFSGLHHMMRPLVGGVGAILTLHHVRP